jgi:hypothetical protein
MERTENSDEYESFLINMIRIYAEAGRADNQTYCDEMKKVYHGMSTAFELALERYQNMKKEVAL